MKHLLLGLLGLAMLGCGVGSGEKDRPPPSPSAETGPVPPRNPPRSLEPAPTSRPPATRDPARDPRSGKAIPISMKSRWSLRSDDATRAGSRTRSIEVALTEATS